MKTIDTRNVQTVEIDKLNERIAEQQQMLCLQDDSINNLLRSCKGKDAIIDELKGYGSIAEIFNRAKELEAKLADANRRFDHVVKFNEKLVHDTNKLFAERDATIKELEAKLAVYDSSKQEAIGLNFDGVGDYIEILPRHTIDEADIPKDKWVRIISAYGMGEDITVIHDLDADGDYIHDVFCSVECPLCGSRKIVVTIEGELEKIRCKECGKTALKHLKYATCVNGPNLG